MEMKEKNRQRKGWGTLGRDKKIAGWAAVGRFVSLGGKNAPGDMARRYYGVALRPSSKRRGVLSLFLGLPVSGRKIGFLVAAAGWPAASFQMPPCHAQNAANN